MTFINIDNATISKLTISKHSTSEDITQTVMSQIILFNKPFNVLCQFQDDSGRTTLKQFLPDYPGFYAAGRLDYDSEGLLILTNDGGLQHRISDPKHKLPKTYWVQVEGIITEDALAHLRQGVELKDGKTQPALAKAISEPAIWERTPPIRERKNIPVSWIALTISEGKNRQVRRMTAAAGFPTLRLIRANIGEWSLGSLLPGEHQLFQLAEELQLPTSNTSTTKGKPQKARLRKTKMPASSRHLK